MTIDLTLFPHLFKLFGGKNSMKMRLKYEKKTHTVKSECVKY